MKYLQLSLNNINNICINRVIPSHVLHTDKWIHILFPCLCNYGRLHAIMARFDVIIISNLKYYLEIFPFSIHSIPRLKMNSVIKLKMSGGLFTHSGIYIPFWNFISSSHMSNISSFSHFFSQFLKFNFHIICGIPATSLTLFFIFIFSLSFLASFQFLFNLTSCLYFLVFFLPILIFFLCF